MVGSEPGVALGTLITKRRRDICCVIYLDGAAAQPRAAVPVWWMAGRLRRALAEALLHQASAKPPGRRLRPPRQTSFQHVGFAPSRIRERGGSGAVWQFPTFAARVPLAPPARVRMLGLTRGSRRSPAGLREVSGAGPRDRF